MAEALKANPSYTVGQNIRYYRRKKKMTTAQVSYRLSMSETSYKRIEKDELVPTFSELCAISAVINCQVTQLQYRFKPTAKQPLEDTADVRLLVRIARKLSNRDVKLLVEQALKLHKRK